MSEASEATETEKRNERLWLRVDERLLARIEVVARYHEARDPLRRQVSRSHIARIMLDRGLDAFDREMAEGEDERTG